MASSFDARATIQHAPASTTQRPPPVVIHRRAASSPDSMKVAHSTSERPLM